MRKYQIAVIGLGQLGRRCVQALRHDPALAPAGVVRRNATADDSLGDLPVVEHIRELPEVDAALICVPVEHVLGTARELMQQRIPLVECARLHGDAFVAQHAEMQRMARLYKARAVVGAGCDPGILSLFRAQFGLLLPHGHTRSSLHTGASLHHTLAAERVPGVRKALATELKTQDGTAQRYVYVELEPGTDPVMVENAISHDPLYLDEQTLVFAVPSIAALEEDNRGVLLERHAAAGEPSHAALLLEARFNEVELAARMMLAACRALPLLRSGAYSLFDLPPSMLWGESGNVAEKPWI